MNLDASWHVGALVSIQKFCSKVNIFLKQLEISFLSVLKILFLFFLILTFLFIFLLPFYFYLCICLCIIVLLGFLTSCIHKYTIFMEILIYQLILTIIWNLCMFSTSAALSSFVLSFCSVYSLLTSFSVFGGNITY